MKFSQFFHILNPNRKNASKVKAFFDERPDLRRAWVNRKSHPTHLETIVEWALMHDEKKIALWGGDGSLNRLMQCLYSFNSLSNVVVSLVPAGTCNDFSKKVGCAPLKKFLNMRFPTNWWERKIDLGLIDDKRTQRVFVNNAGFGREKEATQSGRRNPVKDILSFTEKSVALDWRSPAGHHFETKKVLLGMICNAPFFSGGLNFSLESLPDDGLLEGFFEPNQSRFKLLMRFLKARMGKPLQNESTLAIQGHHIEIESDKEFYLQADGESYADYGLKNISISVLPGSFSFGSWTLN